MISDDECDLLQHAKRVEQQRVELTAQAIERHIFDLLPATWQAISETDLPLIPVEIDGLVLNVAETDGRIFTERECREFISWLGGLCDTQRRHNAEHHPDQDD